MQIADGIHILAISAHLMGKVDTIYPALLWDSDTAILVDTGYPGQLPLIKEEITRAGLPFNRLSKIIITHQDLDHIGGVAAIVAELPLNQIEVLASEIEKPYIQGDKQLLKITPASIELAMLAIPPDVPNEWRAAFRKTLEHPPSAAVNTIIEDGAELPYCGGIIVIGTPGHTPGHLSLYHKTSKTLIAADALIVEAGCLLGPTPHLCADPQRASQSIQAFTKYDIDHVICYHGGLYTENVNARIRELAADLES